MDPEIEDGKPTEGGTAKPAETAGASAPAAPDPKAAAADGKPAEGGTGDGEDLTDEHGHPAISRGKYERDIAAKDARISELEGKVDDSAKTEEGRSSLAKEISELKAEIAEERTAHKLEMAGCRNVKAAKALLEDHGGDVSKLKEAEPWLFGKEKKEGSTGFKPEGAPKGGPAKSIREALKQI